MYKWPNLHSLGSQSPQSGPTGPRHLYFLRALARSAKAFRLFCVGCGVKRWRISRKLCAWRPRLRHLSRNGRSGSATSPIASCKHDATALATLLGKNTWRRREHLDPDALHTQVGPGNPKKGKGDQNPTCMHASADMRGHTQCLMHLIKKMRRVIKSCLKIENSKFNCTNCDTNYDSKRRV